MDIQHIICVFMTFLLSPFRLTLGSNFTICFFCVKASSTFCPMEQHTSHSPLTCAYVTCLSFFLSLTPSRHRVILRHCAPLSRHRSERTAANSDRNSGCESIR